MELHENYELTNLKQEPKPCKARHETTMDDSGSGQQFQEKYETNYKKNGQLKTNKPGKGGPQFLEDQFFLYPVVWGRGVGMVSLK